jgi:hypothetical protein
MYVIASPVVSGKGTMCIFRVVVKTDDNVSKVLKMQ